MSLNEIHVWEDYLSTNIERWLLCPPLSEYLADGLDTKEYQRLCLTEMLNLFGYDFILGKGNIEHICSLSPHFTTGKIYMSLSDAKGLYSGFGESLLDMYHIPVAMYDYFLEDVKRTSNINLVRRKCKITISSNFLNFTKLKITE